MGVVGKRVGLLSVIVLATVGLLAGAGGTAAAPQSVSFATCDASSTQTAVVTPGGGDITLTGPTFLGTNLGAIQDFLNQGATTTFTVNGSASAAGSFSAPTQVSDPTYGAVWATAWSANVPAPAVGAPERAVLQIVLAHVMPQLLAPASDGNAGFAAGATFSRRCTLDGGQPVGSAGGVITTADQAVSLTIPSGALATSTSITVDPSTVTLPTSLGAAVGTAYDFGPTGTQFSAPVTLALIYDPANVPAGSERSLHLAGLSNGVWRLLPSVVSATTHTVSAQIRHFSSYVIVKATCTGFVVGGVVKDVVGPVVGVQAQEITASISEPTATDLTDVNGEYALCVPDLTTLNLRYEPPTGSAYASQWYSGSTTLGGATALTLASADIRADVILGPGTPLTGVVSDRATGLPLANAYVTIHQVTSTGFCCSFGQTLVERTKTDATGRYHAALPTASYKLVSFTPSTMDYVTQWWQDATSPNSATTLAVPSATAAADVSFALVPGFRVRGQVTDSAAVAVANAFASAQGADANGNPSFVAGGGTDATGAYSFVVPAGTFKIQFNPPQGSPLLGQWWNNRASFSAADPLTVSSTQPPPAGGVNAALATGFLISGTLRDAITGALITGGNVSASLPLAPGQCCKPQFVAGTKVNPDGTFQFAVPANTYIIQANPPQTSTYVPAWYGDGNDPSKATPITVNASTPNAATGLAIQLQPGFVISGTVTDAASTLPIANANVNASLVPAPGSCCTSVGGTNTLSDGTFRFVVPANTYILNINPPQGSTYVGHWYGGTNDPATATQITVNATTPNAGTGLAIQLQPGFLVSGTVTDVGSLPIANANVNANLPPPPGGCCPQSVAGAQTRSDGTFSFAVPAGTYILYINPPQGSTYVGHWYGGTNDPATATPLTVNAPNPNAATGLTIQLQPGFVVSGVVTDAGSSLAIPNVNVNANLVPAPGSCCTGVGGTRTGSDGRFSFAVPAGTYILYINPPQASTYVPAWYGDGNDPSKATPITVNASTPNAATGLAIQLQPGFVISGTVTDAASTLPIANANVNVNLVPAPGACCTGIGGTNTLSDGTFRLVVPANTYILNVNGPQGSTYVGHWYGGTTDPATATSITVNATTPNAGSGLAIQLQPGFLISGTVRDAVSNAVIANANVNANLVPAPGSCCTSVAGARAGLDGTFSFAVPAGTYILYINPPQGSSYVAQWYGGTNDPATATPITVNAAAPGGGTGLALTLQLGFLVSGTVHDPSGAPIGGAEIDINSGPLGGTGCCFGTQSATDGTWSVAVASGSYLLYVGGPRTGPALVGQWWPNTFDPQAATVITRSTTTAIPANPIAVVLQPGFRVSGTVTDPSSARVSHVGVTAQDATLPCCHDVAAIGADWVGGGTDANGFWSLVVPAGQYRFSFFPNCCKPQTASDPPYLSQYWNGRGSFDTADILPVSATQPPPAGGVNIVLALGFRISGTVTDAATGKGVANVGVGAQDATQPCCVGISGGGTDPSGFYTLVVPGGTSVKIQFQPNNPAGTAYLPQWYSGAATFDAATAVGGPAGGSVANINAALQSGLVIAGQVFAGGSPLANVSVNANIGGPNAQCCTSVRFSGRTDATGTYRLIVPAGTYRLQFNPQNPSSYLYAYYSATNPGTQDFYLAGDVTAPASAIDVTLTTGLHIRGVVTSGGLGVANVNVGAHRLTASGQCCDVYAGGITAADGSYDIVVPSGTWRLQFSAPFTSHLVGTWYGSADDFNTATNVPVGTADVPGINVALANGIWIIGEVFGPDGVTPATNVNVTAQTNSSCCKWSPMQSGTDASGTFRIAVPAGATYRVQANTNEQVSLLLWQWYSTTAPGTRDFNQGSDVPVGSTDYTIGNMTLVQGYAIAGHVTVGGVPTAFVNVGAINATLPCCVSVSGSRSQADGSYIVVVPVGSYKVEFDYTGHPQAWYGGSDFTTGKVMALPPSVSGVDGAIP